jgi:hypothetical protein
MKRGTLVICPTGKSAVCLSSPFHKNFSLSRLVETGIERNHPAPTEGRFAIVTDVRRDAVDAGGAADESARPRTAKSCGPDASTPASSLRATASDGDKKARSPGRARNKPLKPLRAGMPGNPGATVVTNSCASIISHARLRVHWAPGIPHALAWAEDSFTTRAHRAAGMQRCVCAAHHTIVVPAKAGTHNHRQQ